MKKQKLCLLAVVFSLCFGNTYPVQAAELEILRGEEEETEIFLEGSEDAYSVFGEITGTEDYLIMKDSEEENSADYQTLVLNTEGSRGRLLLSRRGSGGVGLWLRVKVEGKRIGTGTLSLQGAQLTNENGDWVLNPQLTDITIKVLPNPLVVELAGEKGDNEWYTSDVTVTVSDKDAAEIWYDLGEGQQTYTDAFIIRDGETTLTVSSDDGYGYKKEEVRQVNVDTVAPSLSASVQELSWQQENIEVTAGSTDETSGVKETFWAFSEEAEHIGDWNALEGEQNLTMKQDGIWYLHLKATDNAGNEAVTVSGPYHKDSVKPEIVFENLCQEQLVVEGIMPEITVTDERSGIEEITYLLDGEVWSPAEITGKGKHVLTVTAKDMAGNTHTETVEFSIYDCIEVIASAGDVTYTETASFSALALYRGEPIPGAEVEFYLNGENIGACCTNLDGMAQMQLPMLLAPQRAELTVVVLQDDNRFLLGTEETVTFGVLPKLVRMVYNGDINIWNGENLRLTIGIAEHWRSKNLHLGDITKAEVCAELYRIEEDESRSFVEAYILKPNEKGQIVYEIQPETGLYELKLLFTENSYYTGEEVIQRISVKEKPGKQEKEDKNKEKDNNKDKEKDKNNGKKK